MSLHYIGMVEAEDLNAVIAAVSVRRPLGVRHCLKTASSLQLSINILPILFPHHYKM